MAEGAPLVVGVDGSDASKRALRWALQEARRRECPVRVIMAWEAHAVLSGPAPMLMRPELAPHRVREEHRKKLIEAVRTCVGNAKVPGLQAELIDGRASEVLVTRSADAAMLVIGDRGRAHASERLLGSTTMRCIHKARCPVLVVPAGMELAIPKARESIAAKEPEATEASSVSRLNELPGQDMAHGG